MNTTYTNTEYQGKSNELDKREQALKLWEQQLIHKEKQLLEKEKQLIEEEKTFFQSNNASLSSTKDINKGMKLLSRHQLSFSDTIKLSQLIIKDILENWEEDKQPITSKPLPYDYSNIFIY